MPTTQSVFSRSAAFISSWSLFKVISLVPICIVPLNDSKFLFGNSIAILPVLSRYYLGSKVFAGKYLPKSLGYSLFFKFFSPSSELVLMNASPPFELVNKAKSAANFSPYFRNTRSPTYRSDDLIGAKSSIPFLKTETILSF